MHPIGCVYLLYRLETVNKCRWAEPEGRRRERPQKVKGQASKPIWTFRRPSSSGTRSVPAARSTGTETLRGRGALDGGGGGDHSQLLPWQR